MQRVSIAALLLAATAIGCRHDEAPRVRWSHVEAAREAASKDPSAISRQAYIDALAEYLERHPDDRKASELYVGEEVAYARSLRDKGRYAAAVPYYEDAVARTPGSEQLKTELAEARSRISVPRERFEQLSSHMSREEVRDLLGSPRPGWVHTIEKSGHVYETWYYKRADGGLASVSFVDDTIRLAEYGEFLRLD